MGQPRDGLWCPGGPQHPAGAVPARLGCSPVPGPPLCCPHGDPSMGPSAPWEVPGGQARHQPYGPPGVPMGCALVSAALGA